MPKQTNPKRMVVISADVKFSTAQIMEFAKILEGLILKESKAALKEYYLVEAAGGPEEYSGSIGTDEFKKILRVMIDIDNQKISETDEVVSFDKIPCAIIIKRRVPGIVKDKKRKVDKKPPMKKK